MINHREHDASWWLMTWYGLWNTCMIQRQKRIQ